MDEKDKAFEEQIKKSVDEAYDDEMANVNEQLDKKIIFALIGDVNAGKSSTINQIMGEKTAFVSAKPGATISIDEYELKNKNKIIFADTPGLDDIVQDNSEETLRFLKEADVHLFMLNAAGTVFSDGEKQVFNKLKKLNDNILFVLNKIDASDDPDAQMKFVKEQTENQYDVVAVSSKTGENIDTLNKAILDLLKKKSKELLFAKNSKRKSSIANKWIIAAGTSAGAIGAAPFPGADVVPLTTIQVGMIVRLSTLYEKPISKESAKDLAIVTITSNLGKSVFRQIVKFVPGAGTIAGAGVASGMTLALGYAVRYAYENDLELNGDTIKSLYETFFQKQVKGNQDTNEERKG